MLDKDIIRRRLETGITFAEFTYTLLQGYDFLHLYESKNCIMQVEGSDQWGNITTGIELIKKKLGKEAYAFTMPLILDANGNKFGKSEGNALWLDKEKTSPYEFFQYWRNVDDKDVDKCLKMITFIPIEEIEEMTKWPGERINEKKEILAFEITKLVHGEEEAQKALNAAKALFSGEGDDSTMPTTELREEEIGEGIGLLDLLVLTKLAASKGEGRRLIEQGGLSINGEKVTDVNLKIRKEDLSEPIKIKKGKKAFHKVILK